MTPKQIQQKQTRSSWPCEFQDIYTYRIFLIITDQKLQFYVFLLGRAKQQTMKIHSGFVFFADLEIEKKGKVHPFCSCAVFAYVLNIDSCIERVTRYSAWPSSVRQLQCRASPRLSISFLSRRDFLSLILRSSAARYPLHPAESGRKCQLPL